MNTTKNKIASKISSCILMILILLFIITSTGIKLACEELSIVFSNIEEAEEYFAQKYKETYGVEPPDWRDPEAIRQAQEQNRAKAEGKYTESSNNQTNSTASNTTEKPAPPKCEHQYEVKVTIEPTCAEPGQLTYTCSKCGDSYTEEAPATGNHNYVAEITTEADCTHTGIETYTCSVCGDSYAKTIPMEEHKYTSEITKPASCTEDGILTYTCETCGESYTEDIPALGHHTDTGTIVEEASTFFPGVMEYHCDTCGELLKTEVIESKYPTYYLYIIIGICCVIGLGIIIVMLIMKRKKSAHEVKTELQGSSS